MFFVRKKRKQREQSEQSKNITKEFGAFRVLCVFIPGLLPSTLRAALCAFNNFPEIFVADQYFLCGLQRRWTPAFAHCCPE